jgi:hypothetical protein
MRALLALLSLLCLAVPALAGEPLRVTWQKADVLRLNADAKHVIVADPNIVDVTVQSPRLLFLFGKKVGESNITILDAKLNPILVAPVIVTPEQARHVSVMGVAKKGGTFETSYSCLDRCVKIDAPGAQKDSSSGGGGGGGGSDGAGAGNDEDPVAAAEEEAAASGN